MKSLIGGVVLALAVSGAALAQGSGEMDTQAEEPGIGSEVTGPEQPVDPMEGTDEGWTGEPGEAPDEWAPSDDMGEGTGGSGPAAPPLGEPVPVILQEATNPWQGVHLMAGAGAEGYMGSLASRINAGPTMGVTMNVQPAPGAGLEFAYRNSLNEIDRQVVSSGFNEVEGADIVRNGGHIAGVLNVPTVYGAQPYLLAGIGMDFYNVRAEGLSGFGDDVAARVPLAVGLRGGWGPFIADARFEYDAIFSEGFAGNLDGNSVANAYSALLQVGARF